MHPCLGNRMSIRCAVVYYARADPAFSAGIKCLYCRHTHTHTHTRTHARTHSCIHACIHTYIHTNMHTYMHTSIGYLVHSNGTRGVVCICRKSRSWCCRLSLVGPKNMYRYQNEILRLSIDHCPRISIKRLSIEERVRKQQA